MTLRVYFANRAYSFKAVQECNAQDQEALASLFASNRSHHQNEVGLSIGGVCLINGKQIVGWALPNLEFLPL